MGWQEIREAIEGDYENLVERADAWKKESLAKIEQAQKDELFGSLKSIQARLDKIEAKMEGDDD